MPPFPSPPSLSSSVPPPAHIAAAQIWMCIDKSLRAIECAQPDGHQCDSFVIPPLPKTKEEAAALLVSPRSLPKSADAMSSSTSVDSSTSTDEEVSRRQTGEEEEEEVEG
jgi:hypothetical protein